MTMGLDDALSYYMHVRVLVGIVVGLALTHLLRGVASIIEQPQRRTFYWPHLAWVLWTFVYLLHFWWWELRLIDNRNWTFALLAFLVVYALLLFLLAALLFPENMNDANYRMYLQSRGAWFFGLLAIVFVIDFYDTWIKGRQYFHSLGAEYVVRNLSYILLCAIAMRTRNRIFHGLFVIAALIHQFSWIARLYNSLER